LHAPVPGTNEAKYESPLTQINEAEEEKERTEEEDAHKVQVKPKKSGRLLWSQNAGQPLSLKERVI